MTIPNGAFLFPEMIGRMVCFIEPGAIVAARAAVLVVMATTLVPAPRPASCWSLRRSMVRNSPRAGTSHLHVQADPEPQLGPDAAAGRALDDLPVDDEVRDLLIVPLRAQELADVFARLV